MTQLNKVGLIDLVYPRDFLVYDKGDEVAVSIDTTKFKPDGLLFFLSVNCPHCLAYFKDVVAQLGISFNTSVGKLQFPLYKIVMEKEGNRDLYEYLNITNVPTVYVLKNGVLTQEIYNDIPTFEKAREFILTNFKL